VKKVLMVMLATAFIFSFSMAGAAQAQKIGYLDLSKTFDNYEKTKEYDKVLEAEHDAYQKERNTKIEKIQELQGKLALLKEEEKQKQQDEIDKLITELRDFDQAKGTDLTKKRDDKIREILLEVEDAVSGYAKKEGFDFILNDRVLIYGQDSMNVTDAILEILNSGYKK